MCHIIIGIACLFLALLLYVLKMVWSDIDPDIKQKAQQKLAQWFDEDEICEIDNLFS